MYQLENVFVKLDTFFKRILGPRYKWILAILFRYMTATKTIGRYFWYLNIFIAMFYYIIIKSRQLYFNYIKSEMVYWLAHQPHELKGLVQIQISL